MKKFVVFLIVGLFASSAAWGATITINATVTQKLSVDVDNNTWEITVNNDGAEIVNDPQGTLTVTSSKKNYTVTFSSLYNGALSNGTETIPYLIKVNTAGWSGVETNNLIAYTQLTVAKTIVFDERTPVLGKTFDIGFKIAAYTEYYVDGAYTDTITISIAHP